MADTLDVNALITATQAAMYVQPPVSVQAIVNWRTRGYRQRDGTRAYLPVASHDEHGRPLYRLIDVARAEHHTAKRARRH